MKPRDALALLSWATQPQAAGQITREHYVEIEAALVTLRQFVAKHEPAQTEPEQARSDQQ